MKNSLSFWSIRGVRVIPLCCANFNVCVCGPIHQKADDRHLPASAAPSPRTSECPCKLMNHGAVALPRPHTTFASSSVPCRCPIDVGIELHSKTIHELSTAVLDAVDCATTLLYVTSGHPQNVPITVFMVPAHKLLSLVRLVILHSSFAVDQP